MTVLTLDLGSTTGWCVANGATVISGVWKLKGGRYDGGGMRFLRFRGHLDEVHKISPIKIVFYEEVRGHKGVDAAHIYGGLQATLTAWCEDNKIPYEGVPVGTIKKFITGKGNASKAQVMAAVARYGYAPSDDNEADAIALMLLKLEDPVVQRLLG